MTAVERLAQAVLAGRVRLDGGRVVVDPEPGGRVHAGGVVTTVEEALAALPDTADGIAAFLRERGIRGRRKCPYECPLARYVTAETGQRVSIEQRRVNFWQRDARPMKLPAAAAAFIRAFDACVYSDLIEASQLGTEPPDGRTP